MSWRFAKIVIGAPMSLGAGVGGLAPAAYEQYRGAFAKNLSLAAGSIAIDLSEAP